MNTKKILIVDDDIDITTMLSTILKNKGYEIMTADNKEEAMKIAKTEKPDIAILDVIMTTHYEGFELAKEFQNEPAFSDMPMLIHSSIEVLITTRESVREMAREYRKDPNYKELQVILVKNEATGKAGIDYLSDSGKSVWVPVSGFVAKPVEAERILPEVERLIN